MAKSKRAFRNGKSDFEDAGLDVVSMESSEFEYAFSDSVESKIKLFSDDPANDPLKIYLNPRLRLDEGDFLTGSRVEIVTKLKDADISFKRLGAGRRSHDCGEDYVVINPPGADRIDFMVPKGDDLADVVNGLVGSVVDVLMPPGGDADPS